MSLPNWHLAARLRWSPPKYGAAKRATGYSPWSCQRGYWCTTRFPIHTVVLIVVSKAKMMNRILKQQSHDLRPNNRYSIHSPFTDKPVAGEISSKGPTMIAHPRYWYYNVSDFSYLCCPFFIRWGGQADGDHGVIQAEYYDGSCGSCCAVCAKPRHIDERAGLSVVQVRATRPSRAIPVSRCQISIR